MKILEWCCRFHDLPMKQLKIWLMPVGMRCRINLQENLLIFLKRVEYFIYCLFIETLCLNITFIIFDWWCHYLIKYIVNPFGRKRRTEFLNIDLLNSDVSGKLERRWRENIPSAVTTSTISGWFKTRDFSSSFINVLLVVLLILPSIWHRRSGISVRG